MPRHARALDPRGRVRATRGWPRLRALRPAWRAGTARDAARSARARVQAHRALRRHARDPTRRVHAPTPNLGRRPRAMRACLGFLQRRASRYSLLTRARLAAAPPAARARCWRARDDPRTPRALPAYATRRTTPRPSLHP